MTIFRFKLTTQVMLESLESNARTFAELRTDIQNSHLADKIVFGEVKEMRGGQEWVKTIQLIEKTTRASFGKIDDAILPQGDTVMFFVLPFEHKGGSEDAEELIDDIQDGHLDNYSYEDFEEEISEYGYHELRKIGTAIKTTYRVDIDLTGRRVDILFNILEWADNWFNSFVETEEPPQNGLIRRAVELISEALDILRDVNDVEHNFVDATTLSELHVKALALQRELNG